MNTQTTPKQHLPVIIVGGGQAGLSVSYYLQEQEIEHLVLERKTLMHSWQSQRWDSFTLVTPNWQCNLPGHPYDSDEPKGFMRRDDIVAYLKRFADKVKPPVREGVTVNRISIASDGSYEVTTSDGNYSCDQVVIASGGYQAPIIPRMAEKLPDDLFQMHSAQYKNPEQLPDGAVLVVGSGQSGAQIAEDLHLAKRKVILATGDAPRVARQYRGKDVVEWLHDMGYYDISVEQHPLREGVRDNTNHYVTGRDGGREIDLRRFAQEGMELYGLMENYDGENLLFKDNLAANLDHADKVYRNINTRIDTWISEQGIEAPAATEYKADWQPSEERGKLNLADANIGSVLWCIGYRPDFAWLDAPVFNGMGHPQHTRGVSAQTGLYFIGLPWLHTWGSGRFSGVARDAEYIAQQIKSQAAGEEVKSEFASIEI
ncbi:putative oxidoreductase CzcO [Zhongshania aliphaticivorans]|uniref:Putative oxidoreductase CzcO n=1 Tax=Zhongshania aliphaticivorans TaxID=1470434 RepID=A0A5S9NR58_9GAMM|nr:MSMEG_0569 family flavin-dependent oxidoreductase [Zhongshania aliphaticivorans]CAA0093000.1 putative oxidoreductase CzcO [Zhongshania aliphaticivorans]CAA0110711.1 putative oxidoreductase CzcO [Zhongshania aliphaticivorans]